jgi:hypothetical protein
MDIYEAKEIVEMLADGNDPTTGDILPAGSICNDPDVIRALFKVLESIQMPLKVSGKSIEEKKENWRSDNKGLPWSTEHRKEIGILYNQGKTIKELSENFERTTGAIRAELRHQGLR